MSETTTNSGPIQRFALALHETSKASGFWPDAIEGQAAFPTRNFGEMIALAHSELSEALEEHRSGLPFVYRADNGKPEGIAIELVDAIIREMETLASMIDPATGKIEGYDGESFTIDELFRLKAEFNKGRPAKHGRAY